jgi:hypothetical protein
MSPYEDPAVSAGEIADYLYSPKPNPMTELQTAYQTAAAAVRAYTSLAQQCPEGDRPPLLFLASDITDPEGERCDCILNGSAINLDGILTAAGLEVPRLACAIVASGQNDQLQQHALTYVANRPWPTTMEEWPLDENNGNPDLPN